MRPNIELRFLLPVLHLKLIAEKTCALEVAEYIESLPESIYGVYDKFMQRVNDQPGNRAKLANRILRWVSHAKRPMTVTELQHALAIESPKSSPGNLNLGRIPTKHAIEDVCMGLVSIDERTLAIHAAHYSIFDYLENRRNHLFEDGRIQVALACVDYLHLDVFRQGACVNDSELDRRLKEYSFAAYAARFWGTHVRETSVDLNRSISTLLQEPTLSALTQLVYGTSPTGHGRASACPENSSSLHVAASFGLTKVLVNALNNGEDAYRLDSWGRTPLHLAAESGHLDVAEILMRHAKDVVTAVNSQDAEKMTPLHYAAKNGLTESVQSLISRSADAGIRDSSKCLAIDYAAASGHAKVVEVLMKQSCDLTSALRNAAKGDQELVCTILLESNGNHMVTGDFKDAVNDALRHAAHSGSESVIELLIMYGADTDASDEAGFTALHHASAAGHRRIVLQLLREGANFLQKDGDNCTPLHLAARGSNHTIITTLIAHGAYVDSVSVSGRSPLWEAVENNKLKNVMRLLQGRADPNSAGPSESESVLQLAVQQGHVEMARILLDAGANINAVRTNPLCRAAELGHYEVVELLLRRGADTECGDIRSKTALLYAAEAGHRQIVHLLLDHGADVNRKDLDSRSALCYAAKAGRTQVVDTLCYCVWNVDAKDSAGLTPLAVAIEGQHEHVVRLLKRVGAGANYASR